MAATSDTGILLHDILGGGIIAALVLIAILFYKRQHQVAGHGSHTPGETSMDRKFGQLQIWAIFWLAIAATIGFFFVMPRATRQKGEAAPQEAATGHAASG